VLVATYRPDVLDAALRRLVRFDRQVTVDSFDVQSRIKILGVHPPRQPARPAGPMLIVKRLPVVPLVSPALTRKTFGSCEKTVFVNTMLENSVNVTCN
jgi:SpoVK/Ycf46/Vps4 family AAA+-type ATPase